MAQKTLHIDAIIAQTVRHNEDADTILSLCDAVKTLHTENEKLKAEIKTLQGIAPDAPTP